MRKAAGARGTVKAGLVLVLLGSISGCALHPGETTAPRVQPSANATPERHAVRSVPGRTTSARPLEETDPTLAAALRALASQPSAASHRRLAGVYLEHGVLDTAFDEFTAALRIDGTDAVSFEGRARIWRDWGMDDFAIGEASRAVFHAPRSASARNTLATILQRMGRVEDARAAYEQALALDPEAAYALNNLCSIAFDQGDLVRAGTLCRRALAIQPDFARARATLARVMELER